LQSLDLSRRSQGLSAQKLKEGYGEKGADQYNLRLDYVWDGWNETNSEMWLWENENEDLINDLNKFFCALGQACRNRRFEIAVVTHGTLLDQFLHYRWNNGKGQLRIKSYRCYFDSGFALHEGG
jgi:hypothetical protein